MFNRGFYSLKDTIIATLTSAYYTSQPVPIHSWEVCWSHATGVEIKVVGGSPGHVPGNPYSTPLLHKACKILFQFLYFNHSGLENVNIQQNRKDLQSTEMRSMHEIFLSSEQSCLSISPTYLSSAWVYRIEPRGELLTWQHQNLQEEGLKDWRLLLLNSSLRIRKHGSPYGEIHWFYSASSTKDNCCY